MTDLADLNVWYASVTLVAARDDHTRQHISFRLPATGEAAAREAATTAALGFVEATGFTFKIAKDGIAVTTINNSVHPAAHDRWTRELAPQLQIVIDQSGCFVVRYPYGSTTVTNLQHAQDALVSARSMRDYMEEGDSQR